MRESEKHKTIKKLAERSTKFNGLILIFFLIFSLITIDYLLNIGYFFGQLHTQLTFSASKLHAEFALLVQNGMLEQYRTFQIFDIVYMLIYSLLFFPAIAFSGQFGDITRRTGFVFALFFPVAAFFDIIEDVLILRVLSVSQFDSGAAIIYSILATTKLVLFWSGVIWLLILSFRKLPQIRKTVCAVWRKNHVAKVIIVKLAITICVWGGPLLLSSWLLPLIYFPEQQNYLFLHMLGIAYLALCVGYWHGLRLIQQDQDTTSVVWVGIVSNGVVSIYLFMYGITGTWSSWELFPQIYLWASAAATLLIAIFLVIYGLLGKPVK